MQPPLKKRRIKVEEPTEEQLGERKTVGQERKYWCSERILRPTCVPVDDPDPAKRPPTGFERYGTLYASRAACRKDCEDQKTRRQLVGDLQREIALGLEAEDIAAMRGRAPYRPPATPLRYATNVGVLRGRDSPLDEIHRLHTARATFRQLLEDSQADEARALLRDSEAGLLVAIDLWRAAANDKAVPAFPGQANWTPETWNVLLRDALSQLQRLYRAKGSRHRQWIKNLTWKAFAGRLLQSRSQEHCRQNRALLSLIPVGLWHDRTEWTALDNRVWSVLWHCNYIERSAGESKQKDEPYLTLRRLAADEGLPRVLGWDFWRTVLETTSSRGTAAAMLQEVRSLIKHIGLALDWHASAQPSHVYNLVVSVLSAATREGKGHVSAADQEDLKYVVTTVLAILNLLLGSFPLNLSSRAVAAALNSAGSARNSRFWQSITPEARTVLDALSASFLLRAIDLDPKRDV